ncbi:RNA polymerase, sigma 37 subunit, RpsB/SigB [Mycolicibacterium chubuense NBB4]|uniref:RNA polymerase, sigma 37 subunit, RpsB/SigB n=1 Tax=Mycolicibacterium chubuense (strain NBB4) TaxID=710421 RepID=I4BIP4_MYCCN|nr:SigB/SigF/SigG family RNA polymerase sigma factor [Mycolicibacterium chubuense]AFM17151.1 RNA polymerase, sigma 37 subunit, RpsB/SigB [Mycolicibacterium chubuense NBB4]
MSRSAVDSRHDSDYADVADMFRELAALEYDPAAFQEQRERIICRCLPLAEHIALRYSRRGEPHDDLVQIARVGLMNAVNRYDVWSGHDFLSFAVPTIMGEVRRYFRDSGWALAVPRRLKDLRQTVNAAAAELGQRTGRAPTATELAAHLGIDRDVVVETLIASGSYRPTSIDTQFRGQDSDAPALAERIGAPDAGLERVEYREALRPLLDALPERERVIITMRFFESLTQTQIAERLGISQMHVSRLLAKALATLRDGLDS